MEATIQLDLVPYSANVLPGKAKIHDIGGSFLKKLDNRPGVTNCKFSDESKFIILPDGVSCQVEVIVEDDSSSLVIKRNDKERKHITLNRVLGWLSDNYDCVESIGWETLLTQEQLDSQLNSFH